MIRNIPLLLDETSKKIRSHTDIAVLGMSGGADSTLVSILCRQALGPEHVFSLHMPMNENDYSYFNRLSQDVAKHLGLRILTTPIHEPVDGINGQLMKIMGKPLSTLNAGNSRARVRMSMLYGVAHALSDEFSGKRVRVVGTGNLSEDFIGYDTKGGDALADFFPIGDLFKSEVYQLLEYFREQGLIEEPMINRMPSAGLWLGQTDESELGFKYNEMEEGIRKSLAGEVGTTSPVDHFVFERHRTHKHKHQAPPAIALRHLCD